MVFKGLIAATAAVALSATPALASANASAATARAASAQAEVAPAGEMVDGDSELLQRRGRGGFFGGRWLFAVIVLLAVGAGVYFALEDNDDEPSSP